MVNDTAPNRQTIESSLKDSGTRPPKDFTGDFGSILEVFNGDITAAERAHLAVSLTSAKDRADLAGRIAERLIAQRQVLEQRMEFQQLFQSPEGGEINLHVRRQIEDKIRGQVTDPSARAALAEALSQAIAGDEAALAQIQQRYPEFTWDAKDGDAAMQAALRQKIESDLSEQAMILEEEIRLEAEVLAEKGDVAERVSERGGAWKWATEKVCSLWASKSVRVVSYITVGVAATLLIAWGAYHLLGYLQALHAGALTSAGEAASAAAEGGGALAPAAGLEGAGSAVTGGIGSAGAQPNIWIGDQVL